MKRAGACPSAGGAGNGAAAYKQIPDLRCILARGLITARDVAPVSFHADPAADPKASDNPAARAGSIIDRARHGVIKDRRGQENQHCDDKRIFFHPEGSPYFANHW